MPFSEEKQEKNSWKVKTIPLFAFPWKETHPKPWLSEQTLCLQTQYRQTWRGKEGGKQLMKYRCNQMQTNNIKHLFKIFNHPIAVKCHLSCQDKLYTTVWFCLNPPPPHTKTKRHNNHHSHYSSTSPRNHSREIHLLPLGMPCVFVT